MDLTAKIKIPKGFTDDFLYGVCEYAYMRTRDTLPFKTGWMSRTCFRYDILEDGYIFLIIPGDECFYAKYLEYDIPRTRGFWERAVKIFDCYLHLKFKKAEKLSKQTEDIYGLKFNNAREIDRVLKQFAKLDLQLYQ